MKIALEPAGLGVRAFLFSSALFSLIAISQKYSHMETKVEKELNRKNDVSTTYTDLGSNKSITNMTGAAVIAEIMDQNGNIKVRLNNELLNQIENVNGTNMDFFTYLNEVSADYLTKKVSLSATYEKQCKINQNGEITEIQYNISA